MNSMQALLFLAYKNTDMTVVDQNGNTALHIGEY